MQWRLGCDLPSGQCCHTTTQQIQTRICGCELDPRGLHCLTCKVGQGVLRTHNTLAKQVQACAKEAGLYTSENRLVPAWLRCKNDGTKEDAELDFITWSRDPNYTDYVDVTVRHSLTKGTLRRAATEFDTVTTKAEGENTNGTRRGTA